MTDIGLRPAREEDLGFVSELRPRRTVRTWPGGACLRRPASPVRGFGAGPTAGEMGGPTEFYTAFWPTSRELGHKTAASMWETADDPNGCSHQVAANRSEIKAYGWALRHTECAARRKIRYT